MQDRELYGRILGLIDPWEVRDVKLDLKAGEVRVIVAARLHASLVCPECKKPCPGNDTRQRSWRHLDTCQFKTILVADVARVECAEHGVKQVQLRQKRDWSETSGTRAGSGMSNQALHGQREPTSSPRLQGHSVRAYSN